MTTQIPLRAARPRRRAVAASLAAAALAAFFTTVPAAGADARPREAPRFHAAAPALDPGERRPELQRRLREVIAAGAPGAVALVNDGRRQGVWTGASGVADLRSGRPMRPGVRFRAASLTKPFVATVVLQLVAEGRLSLSDTVERRLPRILPYGDRITVRQLLDHTAGVPEYGHVPKRGLYRGVRFKSWTPRELVALVAGQPPTAPPGSTWSYSNTGYVLAGLIIEAVTGHSLGDELRRRIFRPLRLRDTSFPMHSPKPAGPHARGYSLDLDDELVAIEGPLRDVTVYDPSALWAAGNLVSTERDLARFFRALLGGRLLTRAALAEMKRAVEVAPGIGYGLGLLVVDTPCGTLYGHDGGTPGFGNTMLSSADGSRQAGVMVNAEDAPAAVSEPRERALRQAIREAFAGRPCAAVP